MIFERETIGLLLISGGVLSVIILLCVAAMQKSRASRLEAARRVTSNTTGVSTAPTRRDAEADQAFVKVLIQAGIPEAEAFEDVRMTLRRRTAAQIKEEISHYWSRGDELPSATRRVFRAWRQQGHRV